MISIAWIDSNGTNDKNAELSLLMWDRVCEEHTMEQGQMLALSALLSDRLGLALSL